MPMRHVGRFASRAATWPRDHLCRRTMLPLRSWPTMWNEFLPISMPITATSLLNFSDMACSFVFSAPCQLCLLEGREHGRTIPFSDVAVAATVVVGPGPQYYRSCPDNTVYNRIIPRTPK